MKEVALTFDDGPNPPFTNQILAILDKNHIPATFFVCGANIQKFPDLIKEIHDKGHQIGNHSFYHSALSTLTGTNFNEIMQTQQLIEDIIGPISKIFRSPFAAAPHWLLNRLTHAGFIIAPTLQAAWGHDYIAGATSSQIANRVLKGVQKSSVILLHDGNTTKGGDRSQTVQALVTIIKKLQEKGYGFTNLLDLMKRGKYRTHFYP